MHLLAFIVAKSSFSTELSIRNNFTRLKAPIVHPSNHLVYFVQGKHSLHDQVFASSHGDTKHRMLRALGPWESMVSNKKL